MIESWQEVLKANQQKTQINRKLGIGFISCRTSHQTLHPCISPYSVLSSLTAACYSAPAQYFLDAGTRKEQERK